MNKQKKGCSSVAAPMSSPQVNRTVSNVSPAGIYYNKRGQVIGSDNGIVLRKRASASRHFLQKPPAIAWDVEVIEKAKTRGTTTLEVEDMDSGQVYYCQLNTIYTHGFRFDRGHGRQIGLTLKYWQHRNPLQSSLFEV